ncbi:MAG TPA: membrane protein insertase YidC, partial [Methylophilaceae bacterium]|nr:membrane protein insertase YidC [Methylophilaceae bacterium]
MDTKRLVLFVVFSFSIMMLWDAWQMKDLPETQDTTSTKPAIVDTSIPSVDTEGVPSVDVRNTTGFQLTTSDLVKVETDLYVAEISTVGGDLRRLTLKKHLADDKKAGKFVLLDDTNNPVLYIAQSGLIGQSLPNHKSQFISDASNYTMDSTSDSLSVKLSWQENGIRVDKIYTFKRGRYEVGVTHHITNESGTQIQASVYYQLLHDNESNQGSTFMPTFTGGAYYTEADKFKKLSFADMADSNL